MNPFVMACAIGTLIGMVLFFALALTGVIDRWTAWLVRGRGAKKAAAAASSSTPPSSSPAE